jgi:hypothetical protein
MAPTGDAAKYICRRLIMSFLSREEASQHSRAMRLSPTGYYMFMAVETILASILGAVFTEIFEGTSS